MSKQKIVITDLNSPDHMLTFDEIVYKGYNTEEERNKKESISIYRYPLCLYVGYKQVLRNTENLRVQYISDVQRYSIILGHAILEHAPWYIELEKLYNDISNSENMFIQDFLDSSKSYTFHNPSKSNRRAIKTLFYIKESLETKSNILGMNCTDLAIICSLFGLVTAPTSTTVKNQIKNECSTFKEYVSYTKSRYCNIQNTED